MALSLLYIQLPPYDCGAGMDGLPWDGGPGVNAAETGGGTDDPNTESSKQIFKDLLHYLNTGIKSNKT